MVGFFGSVVDAHVNILGGTAYILVLDIDYHHYVYMGSHARGDTWIGRDCILVSSTGMITDYRLQI